MRDASVDTSDLAEYFASSEESELESDAENRYHSLSRERPGYLVKFIDFQSEFSREM